jgi:multiple sugar transport system permease protein
MTTSDATINSAPATMNVAAAARMRKHKLLRFWNSTFITTFTAALLALFLTPFLFMIFTSLKTKQQLTVLGTPIWPAAIPYYNYAGENTQTYTLDVKKGSDTPVQQVVDMSKYAGQKLEIFTVPLEGGKRNMALIMGFQRSAIFIDPANPSAAPIVYEGTYFKALKRPWILSPTWSNYTHTWSVINFPRLLWNTFFYAIATTIGVLLSCVLVAYGFSRFRFPGRDFWFVVLISTMFLPGTVTVIPTFTFFYKIGWVGSWLPLIVPSFFTNPYDTFLLRQFFMTLPRELDEAATIDGASPLRVLWSVIIPQSYAAIVAVSIFHIVWAWNDYFGPLIYLSSKQESQPISVALARFNYMFGSDPQYIQAGALMTILIPVIVFFLAQRFFVQGIVITGVEK